MGGQKAALGLPITGSDQLGHRVQVRLGELTGGWQPDIPGAALPGGRIDAAETGSAEQALESGESLAPPALVSAVEYLADGSGCRRPLRRGSGWWSRSRRGRGDG